MSFGCYFAISITSFLLGITGLIMALTYIMLIFDKTVLELIEIIFGSKGLSTDTIVLFALYFLMTILNMIIIKVGSFKDNFSSEFVHVEYMREASLVGSWSVNF